MPDDAIERARNVAIAAQLSDAVIYNRDDAFRALAFKNRHLIVASLNAFASQQAPEGWRERVRPYLQHRLPCRMNMRMGARECTCGLSAMLDAAPSVTLGEVE